MAVLQHFESIWEQSRDQTHDKSSMLHGFGDHVTSDSVEQSKKLGIPPKTHHTDRGCGVVVFGAAWAKQGAKHNSERS